MGVFKIFRIWDMAGYFGEGLSAKENVESKKQIASV